MSRALVAAAAALLVAGCGGAGGGETLTVSAAASLTDTFTELETRFEAAHPGVDVRMNFAGSSTLSAQIVNGAPSDVFASADAAQMQKVVAAGLVAGEPRTFVTNRLQIAVPPGNPLGIRSLVDLTRPGLKTVVCAPQVPCGAATEQIEEAAGVVLTPVSEEPDVRSVLSKVTSGEADAGLVYVTDVASADDAVDGVDLPEADAARNDYRIATLVGATRPGTAAAFVELVLGAEGAAVFEAAGFGTP